jgi:hypothetical protein
VVNAFVEPVKATVRLDRFFAKTGRTAAVENPCPLARSPFRPWNPSLAAMWDATLHGGAVLRERVFWNFCA